MRILFKLTGSKKIGFGHIRRSYALASYFYSYYSKIDIIFWIKSPDMEIVKKFIKKVEVIDEKNCQFPICDFINQNFIDYTIFDTIDENIGIINNIKKKCNTKLIGLDYFNYKHNNLDLIINLYNHNKRGFIRNFKYKGLYTEGIKFAIIRDSLIRKFSKNKKKVLKNVQNILISFGGGDKMNHTESVLFWLKSQGFDGNVNISSNLYKKNNLKLNNMKELYDFKIKVFKMNIKFDNLLGISDIIFCGGGTTLLESCYVGVPAIVLPQTKRELDFAKIIEKNNSAYVISNINKDSKKIIKLINDSSLRKKIHKSQISFVDGKGKERIRKVIFNNF